MYKGSLVIAGETMCTRPFSMLTEPEFLELLKILRDSDTTYCHLEMNIFEKGTGYPGRPFAISALQAYPIIAHELKWAGIDIVSCAYNHALDWGIPGVLGTIESLDKAGIVHAGTGNNLEESREPAYFESKAGRVAIVSMSTGHHPYDSAGVVKAPSRGRVGVNPLRITQKYVVTPEALENMKKTWGMLNLSMRRHFTVPAEEGDNYFVVGDLGGLSAFTLIFKAGDKPGVESVPNKWDVEGNLRAINDAKRQADLVIVSLHTHVTEGRPKSLPISFVPAFAKECIEAGADIFAGHGSHSLLGIEIYRGKPIFYGPGNFFAQSPLMERFPGDVYEGCGFKMDDLAKLIPSDIHEARDEYMKEWGTQPGGVVATLDVDGGKFNGMKLYPYTLGNNWSADVKNGKIRKTGNRWEGRPMLDYGENGVKIIEQVKKLSEPFNTKIEYKDGIGIVSI
jgi:poly-gamma-glutamate capsule biosynthesis protein CapA/YwtB (metallophosphatase superfamily)